MAIEYDWSISQLERDAATGGVTRVHWRCVGDDEVNRDSYGKSSDLSPDPESPDFIPYENLTFEDVIGWVQNTPWISGDETVTMKEGVEAFITRDLTEKANPTTLTGMPWD